MLTKSKIQLVKEAFELVEQFRLRLVNLTDKYHVEDSIFTFDGNKIDECTKGYFAIKGEYDSLEEAMKEFSLGDSIRIVENTIFQVGKSYDKLSSIKEEYNKVIDIVTGIVVKNEAQ